MSIVLSEVLIKKVPNVPTTSSSLLEISEKLRNTPDDLIDLAASVMDWRHIRHVPVEDREGRLVGLVTHRGLLRMMINGANSNTRLTTVREIVVTDPVTVSPSTSSLEAMEIMRSNRVGCLPVVEDDQLVGIVTSYDFLEASAKLFKQHLTRSFRTDQVADEEAPGSYRPFEVVVRSTRKNGT